MRLVKWIKNFLKKKNCYALMNFNKDTFRTEHNKAKNPRGFDK